MAGSLFAQTSVDDELSSYIERFKLKPLAKLVGKNTTLFNIGKKLYNSKKLSGYRNISCNTCHDPEKGTSDGLSLSLGHGVVTTNGQTQQSGAMVLKRSSPALYNLGYKAFNIMFWDARIRVYSDRFITPEPAFNGKNPSAKYITKNISTALEMQVMFPMVSHDEMLGKGSALDAPTRLESWAKIVNRFWNEEKELLLKLASILKIKRKDLNISHFAKALAHYISFDFNVTNTPYDNYLRGNTNSMSHKEKEGMKLYLTKGQCIVCHGGKHLTNFAVQNIGIPQVSTQAHGIDNGLFEETQNERDKFRFKNPSLRNISKSAPYMHNGSLLTLREVVEHYNKIDLFLNNYQLDESIQIPYKDKIILYNSAALLDNMYKGVFQPFLRRGLNLTELEIDALVLFLEKSLTEVKK